MDDFKLPFLQESRNEWASRLMTILTPLILEGLKSIFDEAVALCQDNESKYLLTFQNFISRIPHWNASIIETERKRIEERSGCTYLQDLITCVHVIQLKLLTAIRAGNKQKKIDITIPKLDDFIHKTYIHVARKTYKNVYLFEIGIPPLQIQKNQREMEIIVQDCIMNSIRDSIPVEAILRAYMDEEDVIEEVNEQIIENPKAVAQKEIEEEIKKEISQSIETAMAEQTAGQSPAMLIPSPETAAAAAAAVTFSNLDLLPSIDSTGPDVDDLESLDQTAASSDNAMKISITDQPIQLDDLDVHNIYPPKVDLIPDLEFDEMEVLA